MGAGGRKQTESRALVDQRAMSDPWRLDPAKFPQRLDLDLTEEVYGLLAAISKRTGRSIAEVALEMLSREMHLMPPSLDGE